MRLTRGRASALLFFLILPAALLRLTGLRWDAGHHLHPDERFISMVEEKLAFPENLAEYFDSSRSPLNPYNRGHASFVYGTLPLFLAKAFGKLLSKEGYDGTYLAGRALSGLFDLLSVWLTYLIARRVCPSGGRARALAAAALMAFCPLGIQLSHFWAVDTFLTAFTAATLLLAARQARGHSGLAGDAATGVALGLAVACKVTGLALLAPVGAAILAGSLVRRKSTSTSSLAAAAAKAVGSFLLVVVVAAIVARAGAPYAFAGPNLFHWRLDSRYVADIERLRELAGSVAGFPPAYQWAGRTILFPLKNLILWGAGPLFGLAGLTGILWGSVAIWRRRLWPLLPLLIHGLFLTLYHGTTLTKSMRYFYPSYPALAVLAALFAFWLAASGQRTDPRFRPLLRLAPALLVGGTFLWGLAFFSIYRRPVTRVAASHWIYEHVPPPARFASEAWDDALPLPMPGHDSRAYAGPQLSLVGPDSLEKLEKLVEGLREADWIAISSNRNYANLTRIPEVFPMSRAYYQALFEGRLGFQWVADFASYPSLGPIALRDDQAEEQFTVYDHPRVLLFKKLGSFSPDRARRMLLATLATSPPTLQEWEKRPRKLQRVTESLLPPRRPGLEKASPPTDLTIGSWGAAAIFYLVLLLFLLFAWPAVYLFFPSFQDRGAGLARIFGLLVATYLLVVLVQNRLLPNGRPAALAALGILGAVSGAIAWAKRREMENFLRGRWRLLATGEAAFAAGFLLFTGLRAFNPEIAWGEKPMDLSILNILVRTRSLPASDPWFAGVPLGYYSFGQEMVALLTLLTGLPAQYTFNLAFGLVGGLAAQGAFSLARNWTGRVSGGIAAAGFTLLLGNLAGPREWWISRRPLDWHYFWATSRVVKDTINEYPFWSLVFADLHAHVLAIPILLFVLAGALQSVRAESPRTRLVSAALFGFAAGAQALTNAWDVPLLAGLLLLVSLALLFREPISAKSAAWALAWLAVSAASAFAVAAPLWVRGGGAPPFGWNAETGARGVEVLTVFGFFFFLAFAWWLSRAMERLAESGLPRWGRVALSVLLAAVFLLLGFLSAEVLCVAGILLFLVACVTMAVQPEDRLAFGLVATGFFLVLLPQKIFISDRMNTFFKLYYETWILFAVATAVLLFRPDRRASFARWAFPVRVLFLILLAGSLLTAVTGARGALDRKTSPSAREQPGPGARARRYVPPQGPTLDGLRYLKDLQPGEYKAVSWLRANVSGTPVILEAQGPSYQDFSRVSMLTGLPTVLGWEHHVKQRGNSEEQVEQRRAAIRDIYSAPEAAAVEMHLRRYHVGYVYVGWLERKTYPAKGIQKFDEAKELFELAYENPETKIFRVIGGDSEDVRMPARETLPASRGAEIVELEEPPAILETPAPGRAPFSGMKEPRDAAVDEQGRVWIADFGNSRLRIFDAAGGFLGGWGGRGSATFNFREPCGVAIRGENLYVADTWNGRIQRFTSKGEWKGTATGLYGPRGVAVDGSGRVWVTDTGNHRLLLYEADLRQIKSVGKRGAGSGEFLGPVGIATGPSGSVYVADSGNRRVQVFDAEGGFLRAWPVPGWGDGAEPHIETDLVESVYVTDPAGNALLLFDASGTLRGRWTEAEAGKKLIKPTGLAIEPKTRILYVVNSGDNSVMRIPISERKAE